MKDKIVPIREGVVVGKQTSQATMCVGCVHFKPGTPKDGDFDKPQCGLEWLPRRSFKNGIERRIRVDENGKETLTKDLYEYCAVVNKNEDCERFQPRSLTYPRAQ